MLAGQVAGRPETGGDGLHLLRVGRLGDHDHERRQVLVERAEAVGRPRAEAGPAGDLIAGLHHGDGRLVVDGVGVHGADEAHVVHHLGRRGQQLRHPHAALAVLRELELRRGDGEARLAAGHAREPLTHADGVGQVLVEHGVHLGLVVVEVHLRRPADHVQVDDLLGLGRVVERDGIGLALAVVAAGQTLAEQRRQGRPADGVDAAAEELTAGFVAKKVVEEGHRNILVLQASGRREPADASPNQPAHAGRSPYLFNTSSKFINSFAVMVHAASVVGSSDASAFDSPTAISFFASSAWAL